MTDHTHTRDDDSEDAPTRRRFLAGAGTGMVAALTPLASVSLPFGLSDPAAMSELATTYDAFGGGTATDLAIEHGTDRNPSWPVV